MSGTRKRGARPPRRIKGAPPASKNRKLPAQTRKVLRTHYAAKYRVR